MQFGHGNKIAEVAAAWSDRNARTFGAVAEPEGVQEVQLAIAAKRDAMDAGFWRAVLGYVPMADDNAVDPLGHGSTVWLQELDEAKPLRHAMHLDVSVAREHVISPKPGVTIEACPGDARFGSRDHSRASERSFTVSERSFKDLREIVQRSPKHHSTMPETSLNDVRNIIQ